MIDSPVFSFGDFCLRKPILCSKIVIAATVIYCDLRMALTDKTQVKNLVELVLPEDFVPSIKTLRECLVLLILS